MSKPQSPYTQAGQTLQRQDENSPSKVLGKHKAFLEARMGQLQTWVRQGVAPAALVRFVLMDMSTNPKLRECTPQSIYLGLLACATTGLEPGALKGEAYLVPFRNRGIMEATYIPGWKGLVKQARRSRDIVGLVANVVRQGDAFDLDIGTANSVIHKPLINGERGDVLGAYAIATMTGGHREIEWVDRPDLDKIRANAESRGKSPAWADWADQMARKTAIRRLCKRLPLGADYFVSLALEQAHDEDRSQRDILDLETDGAASASEAQAVAAPTAPPAIDEDEAEQIEREERARA
jgi:recombination protein RecT